MYREWCDFHRIFVCNKFVVSKKFRILIFVLVVNFFFVYFIFFNFFDVNSYVDNEYVLYFKLCYLFCCLCFIDDHNDRSKISRLTKFVDVFLFASFSLYSFIFWYFLLEFFFIFIEFFCVYSYEYYINYLLILQHKSFFM